MSFIILNILQITDLFSINSISEKARFVNALLSVNGQILSVCIAARQGEKRSGLSLWGDISVKGKKKVKKKSYPYVTNKK